MINRVESLTKSIIWEICIMKNTLKIAFVALLTLSLGLNAYFLFLHKNHEIVKKSVVCVEKIDSIHDTVPVLQTITKTLTKIKHDTVVVIEELIANNDTTPKKEYVDVPFEQKMYGRDSVYKAWVSGFDVNLDSIRIYFRKMTVTETLIKRDNRRFGIGPYVGAGYDINNKKIGWGVGVAITYDFIKF